VRRLVPRRVARDEHGDLVDHLGELRARVAVSAVAVAAGFAVAYAVHGRLVEALTRPLPPEHRHPVTFGVAEPFLVSLKVSLAAGFLLALPIVLWQIWSFLAPALSERVERTIASLVGAAAALAVGGIAFGYLVALPAALGFLTTYDDDVYSIQIRAADYYSFATMVLVAVAVVFQLPVFVVALVRLGVTSSAKLRRNRRIGYVAVAALAVALPGVDPVTTTIEMLPLLALFEGSIWAAALLERRWHPAAVPGPA
jgi:sec-independent protein translocase protein TatC